MDSSRFPLFFAGLSTLFALSSACAKPAAGTPAQPVDVTASSTATAVSEEELKTSIQSAACTAYGWTCSATDTLFELRDWRRGAAGYIILENDDIDTALVAWTAQGDSVSVRLVAQTHDGSGGGIHNIVEVADIAIDDPELGTLSAKVTIAATEGDPEACDSFLERHLVVCLPDGDFQCGGLLFEVDNTLESESGCSRSGLQASVSVELGTWTLSASKLLGTASEIPVVGEPAELAAEGSYSAEAFINTFTLSADGIQL